MITVKKVLFVCSGNICRSPMAEAFFNHLAKEKGLSVHARSTGLSVVLDSATEEAAIAAGKYDVDLSSHRSRQLNEAMVHEADLILTMTERHQRSMHRLFPPETGKIFTLLQFAGGSGDIEDPYACSLAVYQRCAEQIRTAVERVLERLRSDSGFGHESKNA